MCVIHQSTTGNGLPYLDHENLCDKGLASRGGGGVDQVPAIHQSTTGNGLPYLDHENLCDKGLAGRGGGGVDQVPATHHPGTLQALHGQWPPLP